MRKVPQTKWGKTEGRCFHWSTDTRPYQGRILRHTLLQGDEKAAWDSFKFVVKGFLGNRRAQNYEEPVTNLLQSYRNLGCNVSEKIHFRHSHLDVSPKELWCSGWWTWRAFRSARFFNGEEISSKTELCCARRLLLDFGKGCPYRGIQTRCKKKKVCVKWWTYMKRDCADVQFTL